jgi:hypothetical protein
MVQCPYLYSPKTILSSLPGTVRSKVDADLTTLLTASSTLGYRHHTIFPKFLSEK